jgi:hypothetical protein
MEEFIFGCLSRHPLNQRVCSATVDSNVAAEEQLNIKMTAFWDIAPCSFVDVDRRFRGAYCHNHHCPDYEGSMLL